MFHSLTWTSIVSFPGIRWMFYQKGQRNGQTSPSCSRIQMWKMGADHGMRIFSRTSEASRVVAIRKHFLEQLGNWTTGAVRVVCSTTFIVHKISASQSYAFCSLRQGSQLEKKFPYFHAQKSSMWRLPLAKNLLQKSSPRLLQLWISAWHFSDGSETCTFRLAFCKSKVAGMTDSPHENFSRKMVPRPMHRLMHITCIGLNWIYGSH